MTIEDIHAAFQTEEALEYHVTGGEIDPEHRLPERGWHACTINDIRMNGNIEISLAMVDVTVLQKNIPIAFRRKVSHAAK